LFGFASRPGRQAVDALYETIVAAARQPIPYAEWQVPDTPIGRFEMISLHMFLLLHRLRGEAGASRDIAQQLTDEFFKEVEHSIRELGIGDLGVPKRMKKLARMYYGRAAAYEAALDAHDAPALAAALARNIRPDAAQWPESGELARYVMRVRDALAAQATAAICRGEAVFPSAADAARQEAAA